jgi:DNA polymerase/3'-5' exonuclease PolX
MSEKIKHPRDKALAVANDLVEKLKPNCITGFIEIAGSLRRGKEMVGDIEIVFVPKIIQEPDGLFNTKPVSLVEKLIESWLAAGFITKRLAVTGKISSWGANNKHAIHVESGIPVDLFAEPDIQDWPRSLVIRTGSKDFNVLLMSSAPRNGCNAHAYGEALHKIPNGERVIVKTEREFIEACGVKFRVPSER